MKKYFALLLALLLAMGLCACGASAPAEAPNPEVTTAPEEPDAPQPTVPPQAEEVAAEPETPAVDPAEEARALALSLKEHDVAELIEALGEPLSRDYGSSCLVQGGQDGTLQYEGFTVYTLVDANGNETVYDVE